LEVKSFYSNVNLARYYAWIPPAANGLISFRVFHFILG